MKRLMMTVGLPRSGKTTWALNQGCPVVQPDAIRLALHGQVFRPESEPMVWAMAKLMVASLFEAGHQTVILDATNITRKRRDDWEDSRWKRQLWTFRATTEECIERARKTDRLDIIPVIERMASEYEPVTLDEQDDIEEPAP